jgi:hypothetical protein
VTLSLLHPSGEKMLLTKAKIIDNMDTNKIGCANRTFISMKNEMELRSIKFPPFGNCRKGEKFHGKIIMI